MDELENVVEEVEQAVADMQMDEVSEEATETEDSASETSEEETADGTEAETEEESTDSAETEEPDREPEMRVVLSGGQSFLGSAGFDRDRLLWIWIREEVSLATIAAIFANPENYASVTSTVNGREIETFTGFKTLYDIKFVSEKEIDVAIRKD